MARDGPHSERPPDVAETGAYALTLFVSGASRSSAQAVANVRVICDTHLSGRYQLAIVDVNQEPATASRHAVLATPSLIRQHPLPARMVVGNMSDHGKVLLALDVPPAVALDAGTGDALSEPAGG
jgi:circadian clock protein KaiB